MYPSGECSLSRYPFTSKSILSKEDFAKQVKNLRKEALEYQNLRQKLIKESNDQLIKAKSELVQKLQPILAKYSQNNDFSLILQKKMVVCFLLI